MAGETRDQTSPAKKLALEDFTIDLKVAFTNRGQSDRHTAKAACASLTSAFGFEATEASASLALQ